MDILTNRQHVAHELYIAGIFNGNIAVDVTFCFDGTPNVVYQINASTPFVLFAINKMYRKTRAAYKGFKF